MRATNVVLVHGAWADGSCWSAVIERLQQASYSVTAVQLDLISLSEDVSRVRQVLSAQTSPTMLVAHAYGGAVITELGRDIPHVVGLVYVAAFVPDEGEIMKRLIIEGPQPAGGAAIRPDEYGLIWLDRDGFVQYFAPDVDLIQARVLASVQKPIAISSWLGEEPFGEPAWKGLPSWYLVTEQDQIILPAAQRFMARRTGATISSVASSHAAMVSHPDVVATLILQAAASVQEKYMGTKSEAEGEHSSG
jgi:pimeloyl-ACP methyl ester carboxylesterase